MSRICPIHIWSQEAIFGTSMLHQYIQCAWYYGTDVRC